MSKEYAEDRIKDALRMHGGNLTLARQQIMSWAFEDSRLLAGLARPHLNGIIAYQVERVASGRADKERQAAPVAAQKSAQTKQGAYREENFGLDLLRAVAASDAAIFGMESVARPMKKGAASTQHIDAIRHIASKSTIKPIKKS